MSGFIHVQSDGSVSYDLFYRLADGSVWSVAKARFLRPGEDAPAEVIDLISAEGASDRAYLIRTLKFYGWPLGALAGETDTSQGGAA